MDIFASCTGLQTGENGTLEHTIEGVGNARVALFFALVRDQSEMSLFNHVRACLEDAKEQVDPTAAAGIVADLFVLTFQTRNCRGGKGEKSLFDRMLLALYREYPQTVEMLVGFIPRYGCFKDYFRLLNLLDDSLSNESLRRKIISKIAQQLRKDELTLDRYQEAVSLVVPASASDASDEPAVPLSIAPAPAISLCAKFAPREGSAMVQSAVGKAWFKQLREVLFPPHADGSAVLSSKQQYRRLVSRLTAALDVPEVKMCGKTFRDIDFGRVPSLCLNRNRKAFLNEMAPGPPHKRAAVMVRGRGRDRGLAARSVGALRHPDVEDRMECRRHLIEATISSKLHGKQLYPHVLVSQLMPSYGDRRRSAAENDIANVQWAKIREDLVANMEKLKPQQEPTTASIATAGRAIDFTKLVPLVDVSGSMHGDPMHAAIALGILTSEVNHPAFRDRFITFSEQPRWVQLKHEDSIADKVAVTAGAHWGGTTDIEAAFALILKIVVKERLPAEEVPDLIIFSDMQFDAATATDPGANPQTQLERIASRFAAAGVAISGKPYPAPRIVFWNLRAVDGGGYPAQAHSDNVQLLSGFSPSMLEVVLSGAAVGNVVEQVVENGVQLSRVRKVNPYDTLRAVLESDKYLPIRRALHKSQEGLLGAYSFAGPATRTDVGDGGSASVVSSQTPVTETVKGLELEEDWEMV